MQFVQDNPAALIVAIALLLLVLFLLFRPRQSVRLIQPDHPVRPHMRTGEGKGLADEAAAAMSDVTGSIINAQVHAELPGASGPPDNLIKLKGVGPKMAALLNERGITRFDQIRKLSTGQLETLEGSMGPFRGRLTRDRVIDQADYLARGDIDGFEQRFGKL